VHVAALALRDFRSYEALDLSLDPGVTVLLGANGQGKTNLVEAVQYLATLGSHRVATDAPLRRVGCAQAHLAARVVAGERALLLELDLVEVGANRARVNRAPVRSPRELLGLLRTVLFAPEDLAVVKGDPAERRRFLDQLLVVRRPRLAAVRADYDRVLKQRTALLRSAAQLRRQSGRDPSSLSTLGVWDAHLARTGSELVAARLDLLDALAPRVRSSYAALAPGSSPVGLTYRSSATTGELPNDREDGEALLLAALEAARGDELDRGQCLVGPHRDELVLSLGSLPARGYASQGESWSLALALRLASFDLLCDETDSPPVLLLDDVFAELDAHRRDHLTQRVRDADQVVVTAAVEADVPESLLGARYQVGAGEVRRA
jgi:DNA replication and repair protein RecF